MTSLLGGMKLSEINIHVAVTVNPRNKHMKDSRDMTYQLATDNHKRIVYLMPKQESPCKGAIY